MKIHMGDIVLVISGKDRGKQGRIIRVLSEKNRIVVEGVNMRTRHIRKTPQQAGQRIKYEASLSASNVMLIDPKTKKPTRIGYKIDAKTGQKVRIAKVSGEALPKVSTAKAVKPKKAGAAASASPATVEQKGPETSASTEEKKAGPVRQPFWKRAFSADAPDAEKGSTHAAEADHGTASAPVRRSRESS